MTRERLLTALAALMLAASVYLDAGLALAEDYAGAATEGDWGVSTYADGALDVVIASAWLLR